MNAQVEHDTSSAGNPAKGWVMAYIVGGALIVITYVALIAMTALR